MERRDNVRERCAALEQRTAHLQEHSRPVERQRRWPMTWPVAAVAALGLALALPLSVQAKTFRCGAGDVQCLIDAINDANANGQTNTIRLEAGTYTLTAVNNEVNGRNGLPVITSPLTITGRGAETTIIERAAATTPGFRILQVAPAGTLTLKRLTLRGGGGGGDGGGIRNEGTLTLVRTTVTANSSAGTGAGISNTGTLTLLHSAVTANFVSGGNFAGGILTSGGTVTIAHSTIERNAGVGLAISGGTVTLHATTVTRNFGPVTGGIVNGTFPADSIGGTVIITESAITHNFSDMGAAGITNAGNGTMVITNTTIAANFGSGGGSGGGGIRNSSGTLLLTNSTLADNVAVRGSPGITQTGGTVLLLNTILAQNSLGCPCPGCGPDCAGSSPRSPTT